MPLLYPHSRALTQRISKLRVNADDKTVLNSCTQLFVQLNNAIITCLGIINAYFANDKSCRGKIMVNYENGNLFVIFVITVEYHS